MKHKTVRYGYESNSSSSHSLVLDTTFDRDASLDGAKLTIRGDEFGWEWMVYNDALTKANYFATYHKDDETYLDILKEVLEEFAATVDIDMSDADNYDGHWAYIDHQSDKSDGRTLEEIVTKEDVHNFIFNKNCYIITGNDNGEAPCGLLDRFEKVGAKYKFIIGDKEYFLHDFVEAKGDFRNNVDDIIYRFQEDYFNDWEWDFIGEEPEKIGSGQLKFSKREYNREKSGYENVGEPVYINYEIKEI